MSELPVPGPHDPQVAFSSCPYDFDYFVRGKDSGKSLYENYRWMGSLTHKMVSAITRKLGAEATHTFLDFGCARGYTVKALREQGFPAYGLDVSPWAIENCDPAVKEYVWQGRTTPFGYFDWVLAKDVLEHVVDLKSTVEDILAWASKGVFVVVPLSLTDGNPYVVPDYEKDCTHLHRLTLPTWASLFMRPGWSVEASYKMPGVKENYQSFERGNGFIIARRVN